LTRSDALHVVVMGVSGSGKTTIAGRLATRAGYACADADDFHSEYNVAKMARGEPLTDVDRQPWLESVAAWIAAQHRAGRSTVLACSALKRLYRDILRAGAPRRVFFVHLVVPTEVLRERMRNRTGHYMPPDLLDSQLATLEPLEPDEPGITVQATAEPALIVENILQKALLTV
jgi:gluconokinase